MHRFYIFPLFLPFPLFPPFSLLLYTPRAQLLDSACVGAADHFVGCGDVGSEYGGYKLNVNLTPHNSWLAIACYMRGLLLNIAYFVRECKHYS